MVTEAVPGLINHKQRAQLILGLRGRVSRIVYVTQTKFDWHLQKCVYIAVDFGAVQRLSSRMC